MPILAEQAMEGYDMSLEQLARIITFFIVVVTIIFAFIASYSQHDNIVNSLCKFAGQQAARDGICKQKSKNKGIGD